MTTSYLHYKPCQGGKSRISSKEEMMQFFLDCELREKRLRADFGGICHRLFLSCLLPLFCQFPMSNSRILLTILSVSRLKNFSAFCSLEARSSPLMMASR